MADSTASLPAAAATNGVDDLSTAHVPPSFLAIASDKNPTNLTVLLSPTTASSSSSSLPHDHPHPPTISPTATPSSYSPTLIPRARSSSVQLPTTHQVLTPHSKPLTLTSPPTPTAAPPSPHLTAASPSSTAAIAELRSQAAEDRFIPLSINAQSTTLANDLFKLLSILYFPFFLQPTSALATLTPASLIVDTITGGITNTLYRVTLPPSNTTCTVPAVLIRIFGPSTDQVIDRLTETRLVCDLSRSRAGIRIYGHFTNGRLEEWLYANPLVPSNMTTYAIPIATTLANLHSQKIEWLGKRPSPIYTTLVTWLDTATALTWDDPNEIDKKIMLEQEIGGVKWWANELTETLALLKNSTWSDEPLVFCHNDLLSGNILLQTATDSTNQQHNVFLVDYEYSGNNYTAFDIANHFCECCGFECDWSKLPDYNQRITFITSYLTTYYSLQQPKQNNMNVEAEAVKLEAKVRGFFILSHLWWGIWAIIQAKHSTIDFDYLHYSVLRKQGYLLMKEESVRLLKESCKTSNGK